MDKFSLVTYLTGYAAMDWPGEGDARPGVIRLLSAVHFRRYSLGARPISRLKTRLKELSDWYPTAEATSASVVLFARIKAPALYIRHWVRYPRGVWPKIALNLKAKADLDILASRASDSTDQRSSRPECIASIALPRCLSDMAANHPFCGAAWLFA